jgi:hypothetical protein
MVAVTRHRKRPTSPQVQRDAQAAEDGEAVHDRCSAPKPHPSRTGKSQTKTSGSAAALNHEAGSSGAHGRGRRTKSTSRSDVEGSSRIIIPIQRPTTASSKVREESISDSDDAPEEVSKSAAQQLHEQAAAAIRLASQPDLTAKRAEKDRLRAATQAAQAAASRRKAAEALALEELPQEILNAAASVTLTLQQSFAAPRTNHIPLLPEILKKPSSRCAISDGY